MGHHFKKTDLIDSKVIELTAAKYAKSMGLSDLEKVVDITGKGRGTLRNWRDEQPNLFHIVILGCIAHELGFSDNPGELARISHILYGKKLESTSS